MELRRIGRLSTHLLVIESGYFGGSARSNVCVTD